MSEGVPGAHDATLPGDPLLDPDARATGGRTPDEPIDPHARTLGPAESESGPAPGRRVVRTDGSRLGRYVVRGTLGAGGMGKVLHAYDETLGRDVALKVLLDEQGDRYGPRLMREAQALAQLRHPHVVGVYDVDEIDGQLCMAMELVQGTALDRWQRGHARPWAEVLGAYLQAGRGLAAAHAEGLVHRDFKPANCMIDDDGTVKVLDFGLARGTGGALVGPMIELFARSEPVGESTGGGLTDPGEPRNGSQERGSLDRQITRTGSVLGTLAYMAPEQMLGEPADARSDQFSFCVSLFEGLFGERPFVSSSASGQLHSIQEQQVRIPAGARKGVPRWLVKAVRRGLAVSRSQRWPSMDALLAALERRLSRRRTLRVAAAGAVALLLVGGGLRASGAWRGEVPCAGLREQSMSAWAEADRQRLGDAIAASGLSGVVQGRVMGGLDDYAARWTEANAEACEATWVRHDVGEQALVRRKACLAERVTRVRAVVDALATAEPSTVALAPEMLGELPSMEPCDDVDALLRGPEPIPEALADQAEEVRGLIARSWVTGAIGHEVDGLEAAQHAVAAAEALSEAPVLRLEALLNRGDALRMARRWPEARSDLEDALELAERLGDEAKAREALTMMVLLGNDEEDVSAARGALAAVRGKLGRLEDQPRYAAQRWWLEGLVAQRDGRAGDAVAAAKRALEIYEELDPRDDRGLYEALVVLGDAQLRKGELEPSRATYERVLAMSAEHGWLIATAKVEFALAYIDLSEGQFETAQQRLEHALELRQSFYGERATPNIRIRHLLAFVSSQQGKQAEALEHASVAEQSLDEHVPAQIRGQVHQLLGALYLSQERWDEALAAYRKARDAWESVPNPNQVDLASIDVDTAACLKYKGQLEIARPIYDRALAIFAVHPPQDTTYLAHALFGRGALLLMQEDVEAGLTDLRDALELHDALARVPLLGADIRWLLARTMLPRAGEDLRKRRDAVAAAREARRVWQDAGVDESVADVDAWLAECGQACLGANE